MATPTVTPNLGLHIRGPVATENAASGAAASAWDFDLNMLLIDAAIGTGGAVTSVFGRTGVVVAAADDYNGVDDLEFRDSMGNGLLVDTPSNTINLLGKTEVLVEGGNAGFTIGDTGTGDSFSITGGGDAVIATDVNGDQILLIGTIVSLAGAGTALAPTPLTADSSTKIATTAFVKAQGYVPNTITVNGHALSSNVVVSASDITTGTLPHGQLPTLVSGDIPNNSANTSGTAANLSGTPALPNGTTATTQTTGDTTTKLATDQFVANTFAAPPALGSGTPAAITGTVINASTGFRVSGAAATGHYLRGNGTNYVDATIQAGDVPTLNQNTSGTAANLSGTPALPNGTSATTPGTSDNSTLLATTAFVKAQGYSTVGFANPMTTLGDIIYEDATPTPVRLAGSVSATKQFLTQTGNGAISAAPAWGAIALGDLPSGYNAWSNESNATGNLTLANAGFSTTFNQTSAVAWLWANTTAATAAGVNASSPLLELAGTYFTAGASAADTWSLQNVLTSPVTATISNISETVGNVVTLTIGSIVGTIVAGANGTTITLSGLTTGTWLNGQNVTITTFTGGNTITFTDPTSHGTQASHAETGTVTQNNPAATLAIGNSGSATARIQIPTTNALGGTPVVWAGATACGFSVGNSASGPSMSLYAGGSATYLRFVNGVTNANADNIIGSINGQVTTGGIQISGAGPCDMYGGIPASANNSAVPRVSLGHDQSLSLVSTGATNLVCINMGSKIAEGGNNSPWISWAPTYGSANFTAVQITPTVNQAAITNTVIGSALVSNVGAIVFSTASVYTASALIQVSVGTNTALNGTQTLVAQAQRAGSPYTITNSVENSSSVVTLTIGTHSIVANDWVFITGLTTATWLNGQVVKITSVVANISITFTDLTTHGTSATHADTGTVACNYATFALTHANITGSTDTGTVLQQSTGVYTALLVNVTESALAPGTHKLLSLQGGASGGTTKFEVNNAGLIDTYGGNATVKQGNAPILAAVLKTAQSAALASQGLVASTPAAGMWRISYVATVTQAATSSSSLGGAIGFTLTFANGNGDTVTKTSNPTTANISAGNTTATSVSGDLYCYSKSAGAITWGFGYSSVGATPMQYDLAVYAEFLG